MLSPTYPIETARLLLRPLDPATDIEAVHAYQSLPDVCRYVPYSARSREEVAERIGSTSSTLAKAGDVLDFAVVVRESGLLIGDVLLIWRSAEHRSGEIGYVIHPAYQGYGYATEAARTMLRLAFEVLDLCRVVARIDARNTASSAVLRRLGMRQEAVLVENAWFKGEWATEIDFAILATEWRSQPTG